MTILGGPVTIGPMAHITTNRIRIGYEAYGDGPPVLLLAATGMVALRARPRG